MGASGTDTDHRNWKHENGVAGPPGSRGEKGEMGPSGTDTDHRNWKQCAWKSDDASDIGLIKVDDFKISAINGSSQLCFDFLLQDCSLNKTKDDTALLVVFQGNFYLTGCGGCCKRWFITFNGAECSAPPAY
ncbi:unnamed protein product [Porites lobata]|uniref:CTHRC1 C-terminal domain-containing protein n=1 Tax=Porites lobata TaxID=104759 RepID=A0ABN8P500_9CNID|nr:unnamed protein product [Porites lobata]